MQFQVIGLCLIMVMLGFGVGWLSYDILSPLSAHEFISSCDKILGQNELIIKNNTCVPIRYIEINETEFNLTLPIRI